MQKAKSTISAIARGPKDTRPLPLATRTLCWPVSYTPLIRLDWRLKFYDNGRNYSAICGSYLNEDRGKRASRGAAFEFTLNEASNFMKLKNLFSSAFFRLGFLALSAAFLAACVNIIEVSGSFPAPLGERVPLSVGLYFAPEFENYTPEEVLYQRNDWKVHLGTASVQMFSQVFVNLSDQVVVLEDKPSAGATVENVDLIVVPSFVDFGLLDPSATPLEFFSISFKYQIDVFSPEGDLVADWIINAYGKAPEYPLHKKESVKEALMVALRDAAASLTLDFPRQPGVTRYIDRASSAIAQSRGEANSE